MNSQPSGARYRLGFVGAGKLAGSVIRGLMRARFCAPHEIAASEPNKEVRTKLREETGISVAADNVEIGRSSETILLGIKPGVVLPILRELAPNLKDKRVISLAAGVRIDAMNTVADARFMRALTNTPSAICRAATAMARGSRTSNEDVALAQKIFSAIGIVVEVEEEQIDVVTALTGSGPAFVYTVIEAMAAGGVKMGLGSGVALTLATQTVLGTAELACETQLSPDELRNMVVTPGGTTAAGLEVMKKLGTSASLIAALEAATKRGEEMAREKL